MGGHNEQADLRSHNTNGRGISYVITRRGVGRAMAVTEPDVNTSAQNEADTNADTCCLGQNFIPLYYTNRSADVYPYSDAYAPTENVPIVTAATAFDHPDGNTYCQAIVLGFMARQDGWCPGDVIRVTDRALSLSHPRCAQLAL